MNNMRRIIAILTLAVVTLLAFIAQTFIPRLQHRSLPARDEHSKTETAAKPRLSDLVGETETVKRIDAAYGKLPLAFEVNNGQTAAEINFVARGSGYGLALTPTSATLQMRARASGTNEDRSQKIRSSFADSKKKGNGEANWKSATIRMNLIGGNESAKSEGQDQLSGSVNYFICDDSSKWRTDIATYKKVQYSSVYPGIDLVYYGNQRQLEYDLVVSPGTDPSLIRLGFEGQKSLTVQPNGELGLETEVGKILQHKPIVYQNIDDKRRLVDGGYAIHRDGNNDEIGFYVGDYDRSLPLVIDPTIVYSTYLGGSGTDVATSIKVDSSGSAYVVGYTQSVNFPTASPLQPNAASSGACPTGRPCEDMFVTRFNPAGTALIYSTYIGGTGIDEAASIAIDAAGNAYVAGFTKSSNFPVTANAFQHVRGDHDNVSDDAVFLKLSSNGGQLLYSTYLGGEDNDDAFSIAVDNQGNAYVTGGTVSFEFPTVNPFQLNLASPGLGDAFVTKFLPDGSVGFSTFLGGEDLDFGTVIMVDATGIYIVGQTESALFPTQNPFQANYHFGEKPPGVLTLDLFVSKLNLTGTALIYSTYLGGDSEDLSGAAVLDSDGNVYIAGTALNFSKDYTYPLKNPIMAHGFSDKFHGIVSVAAFVTKLNSDGSDLVYSTLLGGTADNFGLGIDIDIEGNAYVTGYTGSNDFPLTPSALKVSKDPNDVDVFLAKINASGSNLDFSTLLGGSFVDQANAIAVDQHKNVYLCGGSQPPFIGAVDDFPVVNPVQSQHAGETEGFVSKISLAPDLASDPAPPTVTITSPSASGAFTTNVGRISLAGTAADNKGVTHVGWSTDQGGVIFPAGMANGTSNWTIDRIDLQNGINHITVTAADAAGNTSSATIVVTYNAEYLINTVAGTGDIGEGNDQPASPDGTVATNAVLGLWGAIAVDGAGNIYVTDESRIRKIDTHGIATTLLDLFKLNPRSIEGPKGLAVDNAGNIIFSDFDHNRIRKLTPDGKVQTIAGSDSDFSPGFSGDGGPATSAHLNQPIFVAVDSAGNVLFSDVGNNRVRRISVSGIITTVAGNGTFGFTGTGGPATAASISAGALAVGTDGGFFISDLKGVGVVRPNGIIERFAGTMTPPDCPHGGECTFGGDGGPALDAVVSASSLAADRFGNVYLGDNTNGRIRRVNPAGIINTIAGTGASGFAVAQQGFYGDGYAATNAFLHTPGGIATDDFGNVYICDPSARRVRKLFKTSALGTADVSPPSVTITSPTQLSEMNTTVGEVSLAGIATDNRDIFQVRWQNDRGGSGIAQGLSAWLIDGIKLKSGVNNITVTATDAAGNIGSDSIAITFHPDDKQPVVKIVSPSSAGILSARAGNIVLQVTVDSVSGIREVNWHNSIGYSGFLVQLPDSTWITDDVPLIQGSNLITVTATDLNGEVGKATLAADFQSGYIINTVIDGGGFSALAIDGAGNIFYTLKGDGTLHKRSPGGQDTLIALPSRMGDGDPLAIDSAGVLYFVNSGTLKKRSPDGTIAIIAALANGSPSQSLSVKVSPNDAFGSSSLAVDHDGNLYFGDSFLHQIKKIDPQGHVTLFAGTGEGRVVSGDGIPALSAALPYVDNLAVDKDENVYLTERDSIQSQQDLSIFTPTNRIRKIDRNGIITTISGKLDGGFSGDSEQPAAQSVLLWPVGLVFDQTGTLFFTEQINQRVRRITSDGTLSTIAGHGPVDVFINGFSGDGELATLALLSAPSQIGVDNNGNIYFNDYFNNRIRKLTPIAPTAGAPPNVVIGSPSNTGAFSTSDLTINLAGTASVTDGIKKVQWFVTEGASGIATGTTNWSIANLPLVRGPNHITVIATGNSGTEGTASITVTLLDDFSIAFQQSPVIVNRGDSATYDLTSTVIGANSQTINLSLSVLPAGVTAGFNPSSITSGSSTTLTIAASTAVPAGVYHPVITAAGFVSHTLNFDLNVNNPQPQINSLSPDQAIVASSPVPIVINGAHFVPDSIVTVNGVARPATFVNSEQLSIQTSTVDFSSRGSLTIAVSNAAPGGGVSNMASFAVNCSYSISSQDLNFTKPGGGGTINVTTQSGCSWNAISDQDWLTFTTASGIGAGIARFQVHNNNSPATRSATVTAAGLMLTISQTGDNLVPRIGFVALNAIAAGSNAFSLRVSGIGFVAGSVVNWNGVPCPTTFNNEIELSAAITAEQIATPGHATITVFTPAPGGGTSNSLDFTIVATLKHDSAIVSAGGNATVSALPDQPGEAGLSATITKQQGGPATISVATYDGNAAGLSGVIDIGGGYVDLQVIGADATDSVTAVFYYPSTITGFNEDNLKLMYFDGNHWRLVRSSGNTDPVKNTADNQNGTVSGGTFTVVFDNTSSPKVTGLTGTVFTTGLGLYGDLNNDQVINVTDLIILANILAGNTTIPNKLAADLNLDGKVDVRDLLVHANYLAGNIHQLPTPLSP